MDVNKILAELRAEREQVEAAILTLERLVRGRSGKRRGRPPAWLAAGVLPSAAAVAAPAKRRGRPPGSKNKPRTDTATPGAAAVA